MSKLVIEIGANHNGDFDTAAQMVKLAHQAGAEMIKFQKRDPSLYPATPYENENSFGSTYREHREALELRVEDHFKLKCMCYTFGMQYGCSVWDVKSAAQIISIDPNWVKIPSARNTDQNLLEFVYFNYGGLVHLSLGMMTWAEKMELLGWLEEGTGARLARTVLYHCTSCYPCPHDQVFLMERKRLRSSLKGFSNHAPGLAVPLAAHVLGYDFIEVHFTLDRAAKGSDHSASIEPGGLSRLLRDMKVIDLANRFKDDAPENTGVSKCEQGSLRLKTLGRDQVNAES